MAIYLLAFLLGIRHGIDWDHIAAISDVTGTSENRQEAFLLGLLYIVGHALIVVVLGIAAITVGINLPEWFDPLMEKFVGCTLILLGLWLLVSIIKFGKNFKFRSRWMLVLEFANKLSFFLHNKIPHRHEHEVLRHHGKRITWKAAFIVGMIHGVGAETPTQVLLFVTAAGVGHGFFGILLLFSFVIGLMLSNTLISILSISGFAKTKKDSAIYLGLGIITAIFSLVLGFIFVFNLGKYLPPIL